VVINVSTIIKILSKMPSSTGVGILMKLFIDQITAISQMHVKMRALDSYNRL